MLFEMLLERSPLSPAAVSTLALLVLLVLAAGFDIAQRRVPNALIIGGLVVACSLAAFSGWSGLGRMALGSVAALVVLVPAYASGMIGAGDVKLISVVGGFLGLHHFLFALLCIFLAGGLVSAFYLWRSKANAANSDVPYAVAVLGGVAAYLSVLS
jgi:prepilin peptidase CpaA